MSSFDTLFSQAVAERVRMHSTDIETMDLINVLGLMTAGELSERTGLTSGATTRLIDRLERAGFVRRRQDPADRRRVIIEPVEENLGELGALFEPLVTRLNELWSTYSQEQLETVLDFIKRTNQVLSEENARLRVQAADEGEGAPSAQT
ncbi:MAG TPA: MarR family transcriptional regulator [Dehalococcoidia bacterium]|nr:MarR family transcriptional regulator [Dehalococcoidia bacterium]